jgi:Yip1 domain
MKKCPTCNRDYDDTHRFCLADGATLVRVDQSDHPTMTMPAQPVFPPPPPPTLRIPVEPSMSTTRSLTNIFFAPARVFDSFRDVTTFTPAAVRFLVAAAIIVVAMVAYNVIYLARIGPQNIARASIEVYPKWAVLPSEQKEQILQVQGSPALIAITRAIGFGKLIIFTLASLPLGALIYWLGGLIFKSKIKYMQALLVWTYAVFAPTVLWLLANTLVLLIHPPTTSMGIMTGANGVIHANLGALFNVPMLPIPVSVVALSALDLFEFYGLALAMVGLRRVARIPWLGSFGIVIFVWMLGVVWHIGNAGLVNAIMK